MDQDSDIRNAKIRDVGDLFVGETLTKSQRQDLLLPLGQAVDLALQLLLFVHLHQPL